MLSVVNDSQADVGQLARVDDTDGSRYGAIFFFFPDEQEIAESGVEGLAVDAVQREVVIEDAVYHLVVGHRVMSPQEGDERHLHDLVVEGVLHFDEEAGHSVEHQVAVAELDDLQQTYLYQYLIDEVEAVLRPFHHVQLDAQGEPLLTCVFF